MGEGSLIWPKRVCAAEQCKVLRVFLKSSKPYKISLGEVWSAFIVVTAFFQFQKV